MSPQRHVDQKAFRLFIFLYLPHLINIYKLYAIYIRCKEKKSWLEKPLKRTRLLHLKTLGFLWVFWFPTMEY